MQKIISGLKQNLIINIKNIPGWSTSRKIVVIECDDWGGIRMPSKEVYTRLLNAGVSLDSSRYTMYDTLAGKEDLEQLYDVLLSVKDKRGKPGVMTPCTNVANPDFEKIKSSGFSEYFYEPFTTTLEKYNKPGTFQLWKDGINEGIFVPESHGREHITVQLWMKKLQEGDKKVRLAFDHKFVSVSTEGVPAPADQFRPEFYFDSKDQKPFLVNSIKDGVQLFIELFGYKPSAFAPSNSIFHPSLEPAFAATGIPFLYAGHNDPDYNLDGTMTYRRHTFGQKSPLGFRYYMRNCAFEPTDRYYKGIALTMKQIRAAFRWHKPAIISSHRVNFVGGISTSNRSAGLAQLRLLLNSIKKEWPDVEFMSSRDLLNLV